MAGDPRPRPRFAAAGGFTPQAKNMPRLRRSNQGVTPEGLHRGSTSGANLFQNPASSILHQVCGWATKKRGRSRACAKSMIRSLFARGILEIVDRFLVTELVGHDLFGRVILTSVAAVAGRLGRNHKAV